MKAIYTKSLLICILMFAVNSIFAANFKDLPATITQPDGTIINCFASGDEFFNYLHDAEGYTIIQAQDGWYYYAQHDQSDNVVPSLLKVGSGDPAEAGIPKYVKITEKAYKEKVFKYLSPLQGRNSKAPAIGSFNDLVIYIRFADDAGMTYTRQTYLDMFTGTGGSIYSVQEYFQSVSYNQLTINAVHFPDCVPTSNLSFQDSHNRSYFQPYNASTNPGGYVDDDDARLREHTLLKNAITSLKTVIEAELTASELDMDNNGDVDNITFIISGDNDSWSDLLWAHRWALWTSSCYTYLNGKMVWDYNFQPESQSESTTTCHELFHCIGSPDLYHYTGNSVYPCWYWDLMEYGTGSMTAYMKEQIGGWITIPSITSSGTYSLSPLAGSTNNAYKIALPNSTTEFLILEFRKKTGPVETYLPSSVDEGLLIYRINSAVSISDGNRNGPPDMLWVYRPNGNTTTNGNPSDATFSSTQGRTTFNAGSNPACNLSDDATWGGISITNVGAVGTTISFNVQFPAYNITFNVNDASGPINAATVVCDGVTQSTNSSGQTIFSNKANGTYNYTVSKTGYQGANGTVTVSGSNATKNVTLTANLYSITFTVNDGTNPINTATVVCDGITQSTNSSGQTVFSNKANGTYNYSVSKTGYQNSSGTVTVSGGNATKTVSLGISGTTQLTTTSCSLSTTNKSATIYCDKVTGGEAYEFEFTNADIPLSQIVSNPTDPLRNYIKLSDVPGILYGRTYDVRVRVRISGVWSDWGGVCPVTLLVYPTTITTSSCGLITSNTTSILSTTLIANAQAYEFEFINTDLGFSTIVSNPTPSLQWIRLNMVPNIKYGRIYNVRSRVKVDNMWSTWSSVCNITLSVPFTTINPTTCGITTSSLTTIISAAKFASAQEYQFEFSNTGLGFVRTLSNPTNPSYQYVRLSNVSGLLRGNTYNVRVRMMMDGMWGGWSPVCTVTLTSSKGPETEYSTSFTNTDFVTYPNPFNHNFSLIIEGNPESEYEITAYDITGKVLYKGTSYSYQELTFGEEWEKGMYIISVTGQDYSGSTKVIKTE